MSNKEHGWRLKAELLILLVVIYVPAFFLLQEGSHTRQKSRIANCQSNLRQIGLAIAMYSDLYGGRCPDAGAGHPAYDHFNLLTNVISTGNIFVCPSDHSRMPKAKFVAGDALPGYGNLSYGYVDGLKWHDEADSILAFDRSPAGAAAGSSWNSSSPHQDRGGNQLFLDGRVEYKVWLMRNLKGASVDLNP